MNSPKIARLLYRVCLCISAISSNCRPHNRHFTRPCVSIASEAEEPAEDEEESTDDEELILFYLFFD